MAGTGLCAGRVTGREAHTVEKEGREGGKERRSGGFLTALEGMKRNNTGRNMRHHFKTV